MNYETEEERIERERQELLNQRKEIDRIMEESHGRMDTTVPQSKGIADLSDEEIEFLEKQNKYRLANPTIVPETEQEKQERLFQESISSHREVDRIMEKSYGRMDTTVPQSKGIADLSEGEIEFLEAQKRHSLDGVTFREPEFKNIESMDENTIRIIEANIEEKRQKEMPTHEIINTIVENGIPENHKELKELLQEIVERKDFIKELIEKMRDKLLNTIYLGKKDFSEEVSIKINEEVYKYLATLNALKELGSNLNQTKIMGQYDLNFVDLGLSELSDELQIRRKNNCNIDIPIPKEYDLNNPQAMLDAIRIMYFMNLENEGTKINWEQYGYVPQEDRHR